MNALRRLVSRRAAIQETALPVNPLVCQQSDTSSIVDADGRHLKQLNSAVPVKLIMKEELAPDTFVYRFALPEETRPLGHFTCQYLQFECEIEGQKF